MKPANTTCPNQRDSRNAPCEAAQNISTTSSSDVGIGVPSKYFTLSPSSRQRLGRNVVARQAGYSARNKIGQDNAVVQALHAATVANHGRGYAEGDDVGERVELTTHTGSLLSPPGNPSIQDIEDQSGKDHPARKVDMPDVGRLQVGQHGKHCPRAADRVASVNQSARWNSRIIEKVFVIVRVLTASRLLHFFENLQCLKRCAGILEARDRRNSLPTCSPGARQARRTGHGAGVSGGGWPFRRTARRHRPPCWPNRRQSRRTQTLIKAQLAPAWTRFFEHLADKTAPDLNQRAASLARQVRDNGVTDNIHADEDGLQRPWSLDLFPLIIEPDSWQQIESGVLQRMRLLERIMADIYGPQQLLMKGWLPPALVQGHPGYLRAMHGVKPVGGMHLHVAAFDLARGPDGNWWLVGQHCQAPSGLGNLLENRLAVASQFPEAFQALRVQGLAGTYRALMDSLKTMCPTGANAHLALLTPGPYNETYFEQAYLARYLGLSLVEGSDLIVRDERLYLKTLQGLVPVHGLLTRVDDEYLDPLELRADSTLGVPGLLQAIRAGHVLVANAPGSAFLESPALLGFLPALSRHLLGEELQLPALPTWWCGERSALEDALPQLRDSVIKATYPGSPVHNSFDAVLGCCLSARELDEWAGRIARQSEEHTIQAYLPLSQMPTWQTAAPATGASTAGAGGGSAGQVLPRSVMLRVFVVSSGLQSWRVVPGGLARVAGSTAELAAMQRGGSSADVWALTCGEVDQTTLLQPDMTAASVAQPKRLVTSRAAENLFWLGRYTERTENALRLARLTLECLNGEGAVVAGLAGVAWRHGAGQHAGAAGCAVAGPGAPRL